MDDEDDFDEFYYEDDYFDNEPHEDWYAEDLP